MIPLDFGDPLECTLLAAIIASPAARAAFMALKTGPAIFSEPAIHDLAGAVLSDPHGWTLHPKAAVCLAAAIDGRRLGDAIYTRIAMLERSGVVVDDWAVDDVRRCCGALAGRWMPGCLGWAASQLERGVSAAVVAEYLEVWLGIGREPA